MLKDRQDLSKLFHKFVSIEISRWKITAKIIYFIACWLISCHGDFSIFTFFHCEAFVFYRLIIHDSSRFLFLKQLSVNKPSATKCILYFSRAFKCNTVTCCVYRDQCNTQFYWFVNKRFSRSVVSFSERGEKSKLTSLSRRNTRGTPQRMLHSSISLMEGKLLGPVQRREKHEGPDGRKIMLQKWSYPWNVWARRVVFTVAMVSSLRDTSGLPFSLLLIVCQRDRPIGRNRAHLLTRGN